MPDALGALCALGIGLFVFAALGHGLWVAVRAIVRAVLGIESTPSAAPQPKPRCQRCESPWDAQRNECAICGWPAPLEQPQTARRALRLLREQVNDWANAGVIDQGAQRQLMQTVEAEDARLIPAPRPAPPVPAPVVTKPIAPTPEPVPTPLPPTPPLPSPVETIQERLRRIHERQPDPVAEVAVVAEVVESGDHAASPFRPAAAARVERLAEPPPPRRSFSELFLSFMEEKNIRWGELIGGLLIICCSIALVISFWNAIAERPVLKFIVFNGVNAALFGAAMYTERRWKLPNTSRGLFIIASLLVPLNFLAMAAFSAASQKPLPLTLVGEALSVALFGFLLWLAGRSMTPHFAPVLSGAVMIPAIAELLVRHFIVRDSAIAPLVAVGTLPVAAMLGAAFAVWRRSRAWNPVTDADTHELFRLTGISAFAGLASAGLLIARAGATAATMERLSPLIALYACGPLAIGLILWKRLRNTELTGSRIAGTAMAVAAVMLMALAMTFAWPQPAVMLAVLVVEAAVLLAVARVAEMPAAVLPGSLCASLGYLIAYHGLSGRLAWRLSDAHQLLDQLVSAPSGLALVGAATLCGGATAWFARLKRESARYFGIAAGINALVSLGLVSWFGFAQTGDPHYATWVYLFYGVAALTVARWALPRALVWSSAALVLAALVQGLVFGEYVALERPWLIALLAHASAFVLLAIATEVWTTLVPTAWRQTALEAATVTAALATLLAPVGFVWGDVTTATVSWQLAWASLLWLTLAYAWRSVGLFALFQTVATVALLGGVTAFLERQAWYRETTSPLLDPWTWEAWGVTLAASCLVWMAARAGLRRYVNVAPPESEVAVARPAWFGRVHDLLSAASPAVEMTATGLAITVLLGVSIYAIVPGVAQELAPRSLAMKLTGQSVAGNVRVVPPLSAFEWLGVPHAHGHGAGAWALFAACVLAVVAKLRERLTRNLLVTLILVAGTACLLIAAPFEATASAASALRWCGAIFLLATSALVWAREPLARWCEALGLRVVDEAPVPRVGEAWLAILCTALLPLIAMGGFVGLAAVAQRPAEAQVLQWTLGMLGLFAVAGIAGLVLQRVEAAADARNWFADLGRLLTVIGAMPLVVMVLYVVSTALRGNPVVGPEPGSLFHRLGLATSYAGPLAIITLTLIGHALRERSSGFALSAGLVLNLCATAAFLLAPRLAPLKLDAELWVQLAQLNAGVSGGFAILWLVLVAWRQRRWNLPEHDGYRTTQATLGLVLLAIVFIPAAFDFWADASLMPVHKQVGSPAGWVALALAVIAAVWNIRPAALRTTNDDAPLGFAQGLLSRLTTSTGLIGAALWTLSVMTAFSVGRTTNNDWTAFHTLQMSHVVSGALILGAALVAVRSGAVSRKESLRCSAWVFIFAFLANAVAVRGAFEDVNRPGWWWSVVALALAAALLAVLSALAERRRYLYFSSVCVTLAASIWWFGPAQTFASTRGTAEFMEFVWFNVTALALPAIAWLGIERRYIAANTLARTKRITFGAHRFVAALATLIFAATVGVGLAADANAAQQGAQEWLGWLALGAVAAATLACLWDPLTRLGTAALYGVGVIGIGFAVDRFNLPPKWLAFNGAVIAAAYGIATSYLWSRRAGLQVLGKRLGMPVDAPGRFSSRIWLPPANGLLIAGVLTLVTGIVLRYDELALRLLAGKAAWFQVVGLALLARGEARHTLRYATLALGVLGGVLWGWAWLDPSDGPQWIDRGVIVLAALAAAGVLYGFGLVKLLRGENPWISAGKQLTPICIGGALVALVVILGGEVAYYLAQDAVPIAAWGKAVVAAVLVGLAVAAIVAAVVPGRDPLGLSERGRQAYVYGAEALLAATFLHIRICLPWLFHGFFTQYWPLVVMLIAFLGVGLSEWFRRRQQAVLSEPLERTGALLPMLPVAGFWMIDAPGTDYSVLLLVVGSLYAALAVLRKSFGFGVLAALAANGGLWYFLHKQTGLGLLEHPQIWLIPPAVCVLVAAYLNRERLSASQLTQIRYVTAMTIYVSSTADIFLNGMAESPWLALVLGGLSIVGVMVGIFLRVRAFLYLGTTFLCMSLMSIIWYAAHDRGQTWVYYASGIVAGVVIIAAFAVLEKKRQEFQHMLERLREWEA